MQLGSRIWLDFIDLPDFLLLIIRLSRLDDQIFGTTLQRNGINR